MNIKFLIICYFTSLFVDWIFQSQKQANAKSNWIKGNLDNNILSFLCLLEHSYFYATLTTLFTLWLLLTDTYINMGTIVNFNFPFNIVFIALFISHIIIDSRFLVKGIMKLKGFKKSEIYDYQTYGFMHIGIDHRLHEAIILALAFFVK